MMKNANFVEAFPPLSSAEPKPHLLPSKGYNAFEIGERSSPLYRYLRTVLPVPMFALLWVFYGRTVRPTATSTLLEMHFSIRHIVMLAVIGLLWAMIVNLHIPSRRSSLLMVEIRRIVQATLWCSATVFFLKIRTFGWQLTCLDTGLALVSLLSVGMFLLAATYVVRSMVAYLPWRRRLVLIVGSGPRAFRALDQFKSSVEYTVLGCIDDECVNDELGEIYLGGTHQLESLLKQHPVEALVICLPVKTQYSQIQRAISIAESVGVEIHHVEDVFTTTLATRTNDPLVSTEYTVLRVVHHDVRAYVKRMIDILGASVGILLTGPIMLIIAAAIALSSDGPILFVQQRYGKNRSRFPMYKFRTMVVDAEARQASLESQNEAGGPTFKMKKDPRITPIGNYLRRTSLDELPQLFNVLKGDMSLVGPRPLPVRDVSRFEESWLLRRFSVTPGLTCLWQISGRSNTAFDNWMRQDLDYIDNWSLALDCRILLQTLPAVLRGRGAM
jgi:exopolysaccharide biosynthesis polyprenyl glycosylphosphotransferase